jgi:hypothetical protein
LFYERNGIIIEGWSWQNGLIFYQFIRVFLLTVGYFWDRRIVVQGGFVRVKESAILIDFELFVI